MFLGILIGIIGTILAFLILLTWAGVELPPNTNYEGDKK